jgi:PAS domain S-box-containing protein
MKRPVRVLLLEDRDSDAELILRELSRSGFVPECERVQTEEGFLDSLQRDFDIIISDYSMPQFTGMRALDLLQRRAMEIPFILVSGTIGEDSAVDAMRRGATDYLLKDRMARLGPAVTQALEQNRMRKERALAEEALRESEERFRQLAENIREVFWLTDPARNVILYVSPAYERIWGRTQASASMGASSWLDTIHPEDREAIRHSIGTKQAEGSYDEEYRIVRPDGSIRWIHDCAFPVRNGAGEIYRVAGVARDITESKQSKDRLREQAKLLDLAQDAIIVRDMADGVEFWNHGAEKLYGWSAAEVQGKQAATFVHGAPPSSALSATIAVIENGKWSGECKHLRKGGGSVIVRSRWTLVRDEAGAPKSILIINTDITEQKRIEEQLLRTQRLESIGTLASGVAHDLNNILAPILMGAAVLRRAAMSKEDGMIVSTIETCAQRGADIVKQVLTFARGADGARLLLQPGHLISEMSKIAQGTFPKAISVQTSYPQSLWPIEGDPTQLHQILLNLCVNARDAMPAGGKLIMSARNFAVDEHYASMTLGANAGPHVLFEVQDTGMGIPHEIIDKIFDPFFTTKDVGHGTGLGLSTVIGIVKSHGGFLNVESEIGNGTTFKIYLPAKGDSLGTPQADDTTGPPLANGELLLIVDDEQLILHVTRELLEAHGYQVVAAGDATEALAIFAQRKDEIDLVLTDLAMPLMDGVALIRTLQKMQPNVCVIASTGQGGLGQGPREHRALNVRACLAKPYNKETLLKTLHDALHLPPNYTSEPAQVPASDKGAAAHLLLLADQDMLMAQPRRAPIPAGVAHP